MDSGASNHLTNRIEDLYVTRNDQMLTVQVADGRTVVARAKGRLRVRALIDDGKGNTIERDHTIDNVYYVPEPRRTLPSASKLIDTGHDVRFTSNCCTVYGGNRCRVKMVARLDNGVYTVVATDQSTTATEEGVAHSAQVLGRDLETWH